jgi:hypothetical protein
MRLSPRLVTLLSLLQVFAIVAGFSVTRSFLKIHDRIIPQMLGSFAAPIPTLLEFVRSYGPLCLLLPLIWTIASVIRLRSDGDKSSDSHAWTLAGVALTIALMAAFLGSAMWAVQVGLGPPKIRRSQTTPAVVQPPRPDRRKFSHSPRLHATADTNRHLNVVTSLLSPKAVKHS